MYKGIKLKIYPNFDQQAQIFENFGAVRFVWNEMLNMQSERYQNNKQAPFLNGYAMMTLLTALEKEYPWLEQADSTSLQDTCQTLAKTFQQFFKKISYYPRFKSRKYPKQSFKIKKIGQNIKILNEHYLILPKIGLIKYRGQLITDNIKHVIIKRSASGRYYAIFLVDCESQASIQKTQQAVGLDFGVADLIIASTGFKYPTLQIDKKLLYQKQIWERKLARRRKLAKKAIAWDYHQKVINPRTLADFKNYIKAKEMVAKYSEKIANQRQDYLQKITTKLVKQYDTIVIEDLKTKNLLKNHHLAKAIANQAWRKLRELLTYKTAWYDKELIIVNPYKTSQICSNCGYDDGKHGLNIREWTCPQCHIHHDRDINASKNILNLGLG